MAETKRLAMGILAHVDAGKTTLSEALLYHCGAIRSLGRVDRKNTLLDNHELERKRGITIFSKQAQLGYNSLRLCLLDTPGHVDFSAETERTLEILDLAVLVISGIDGVQAHTETLWRLLARHRIPTLIFVTKCDLAVADRAGISEDLRRHLSETCTDFALPLEDSVCESLAMCDESVLEHYTESGRLSDEDISELFMRRKFFPVLYGSGLKLEGIEELLDFIERFAKEPFRSERFGARVYKILRDTQGKRLSLMKITGGELRVRDEIDGEKITELRLYNGAKYEQVDSVCAGTVCAAAGLSQSFAGQGLGDALEGEAPCLEPCLSYHIGLPEGVSPHTVLPKLRQLEDEDPMLRLSWSEQLQEIRLCLMGEIQTQVIRALIKERFELDVTIDSGGIMYRETIKNAVEGAGHFEPLRHYAEVHLALSPLPLGSGIEIVSECPTEELSPDWQQSILTSLMQKEHRGVLLGAPLTDVRISLIAARTHIKHTEGGDLREAALRAVRQGLMKAESVLLEPWYEFSIELPPELLGRAINDIRAMSGEFETEGAERVFGIAPVSELRGYASVLAAYSSGRGRIRMSPAGYRACHNTETVLAESDYRPEADTENSPDSVFCSHGAATLINWREADSYMHIETDYFKDKSVRPASAHRTYSIDDRELEAIMEREFGKPKRRLYTRPSRAPTLSLSPAVHKTEYLIVDGYNLIFAWEELSKLAEDNLELARARLEDILKSYRGFKDCELVLVYDGYKRRGNPGEREHDGIRLVFTRENETADMYIEKLANDIGKNYAVKVVTNDSLIRLSALRSGVLRLSSTEFIVELESARAEIAGYLDGKR